MKNELTDIVGWSHFFLAEILKNGDTALDLTAGGGQDTLFLARQVCPGGKVLSFDIQAEAIARTSELLEEGNVKFFRYDGKTAGDIKANGVCLIHGNHVQIENFVKGEVKGAIANLGYLPGGDKNLTTLKETTLVSLHKSAGLIQSGGRMVVVAYVGHPGGLEEEREVSQFFHSLVGTEWRTLKVMPWNRENSPALWVAERF
jgi:SAM-dependent methyltransferase